MDDVCSCKRSQRKGIAPNTDKNRQRIGTILLCQLADMIRNEGSKYGKAEKLCLQYRKGRHVRAVTLDLDIEPGSKVTRQYDGFLKRWHIDALKRLQLGKCQLRDLCTDTKYPFKMIIVTDHGNAIGGVAYVQFPHVCPEARRQCKGR
jgi:hypothetical protein